MTVTICLGSACHVKGSHFVLEQLKALIKENNLEDKVTLAGTFCTGNCQKGVCVRRRSCPRFRANPAKLFSCPAFLTKAGLFLP